MPTESNKEVAERIVRDHFQTPADAQLMPSQIRLQAFIQVALDARDERAAKILEARADELQAEWDAPPNASNGFIAMTVDTPAGYATWWGMNTLRKLAAAIRGKQ